MDLGRDCGVRVEPGQDGSLRVDGSVLALHARQLADAIKRLGFVWRAFPPALRRAWTVHLRADGSVDVTRGT